jgi:peptidoglycan/LPS O-acetylase OafA/YrhL
MAASTEVTPGSSAPAASTPDPVVERAPRIPHLRALDGLRGIAVLAVVLYHFSPDVVPGGFLGVDMFFVLSGFLITSLLVAEREGTGHTALRDFWIRRARRLFPALLLVLGAVGLWAVLKANPLEADRLRDDGLATLGYVANWRFVFSGQSYLEQFVGVGPSPLRHTWSLAIEEQFYLVWPLVVAGLGVLLVRRAARAGRPTVSLRRALIGLCLGLAVVSVVVMAVLFTPGDDPSRVYYGTDSRAHLLLIGGALGAASAGILAVARAHLRRVLVVAGCVAVVGLVVAFLTIDPTDSWLYDAGYGGIAIGVALIIAAAGQPGVNPLARVLSVRPLVGLGLISYGVYLWHWPIAVWFTPARTGLDGVGLFALRAALTLVVSLASYFLVEMPVRRGVLRRINPMLPKILTPVAVLLAVFVLLLPTIGVRLQDDEVAALPAVGVDEVTADYTRVPRCDGPPPESVPASTDGYRVVVYGNSVAEEVAPCLGEILEDHGMTYRAYTQSGAGICDFFPIMGEHQARPQAQQPDAVVLYFLTISFTDCTKDRAGGTLVDRYARDMAKAVADWRSRGVDVYLVPPMLPAGEAGVSPLHARYDELKAEDPEHVHVVDTGTYLRDRDGVYQWQMPCVPGGEEGCGDDDTVGVRLALDGEHMCTDGAWRFGVCAPEFAAGERRGAAAIAAPVLLTVIDRGKP